MTLDLYNNPFNNFVQRTYQPQTPQNRLQNAYEKAMSNRTPEWARTVSDMMPSLAEIGAYFGTKGAFNQGRIVDSLEREKQRRTAYNQMMRENENKQVNDYVQLAKEQLGMDMAQDDREFQRNQAQLNRDTERERSIEAQNRWQQEQELKKADFDFRKEQADRAYNMKIDELNAAKENAKTQAEKEAIDLDIKKENLKKLQRENSDEYIEEQKQKEQYEKDLAQVNKLIEKGNFNAEDRAFLLTHPEAYKEIDSRVIFSPFRGKFKIPKEVKAKYEKAKGDTYGIFNMKEDLTLGDR